MKLKKYEKLAIIFLLVLIIISIATQFYGTFDRHEYVAMSRFFAGNYNAKIRTSHSMLAGVINAPLIYLFNNILILKAVNLLFLILIVISVYYISKKDKRALLLMVASPIVWYMGPWISSIQLASLLFLWAFFFFKKFEELKSKKYLFYSGILVGLSISIWNTILFLLIFFLICFFYGRNINHLVVFLFSMLIGFIPLFILDYLLYSFPFYSLSKFFFGVLVSFGGEGIYTGRFFSDRIFANYLVLIFMLPFFAYTLFSKKFFKENKRVIIFILLVLLFYLSNPQTKYLLIVWPILILSLSKSLNEKQFKKQFIIFLIISLVVINPYLIQTKYFVDMPKDISATIKDFNELDFKPVNPEKIIESDLNKIIKDYPNEVFVVGNEPDSYVYLAQVYLGKEVNEFASIQDYELYLKGESNIFEKKITLTPNIQDRRQIWLAGGVDKNENDNTDYENITLGIGLEEPLELENFELIKQYDLLYLSKKIN